MERRFYLLVTLLLFWNSVGWFLYPFLIKLGGVAPSFNFSQMFVKTTIIGLVYITAGIVSFFLGLFKSSSFQMKQGHYCPHCSKRIERKYLICPYCLQELEE